MYVSPANKNKKPLETAYGEIISELIGKAVTPSVNSNHSLARIVIPPGKSSSQHFHKYSQETYLIMEGEGQMQVDKEKINLLPGQVCYIEPGEIHQIRNDGGEDLVFLAVCVPAWVPDDSFDVDLGTKSF